MEMNERKIIRTSDEHHNTMYLKIKCFICFKGGCSLESHVLVGHGLGRKNSGGYAIQQEGSREIDHDGVAK